MERSQAAVWWRAMNERLLRDGCEAVALLRRPRRGDPVVSVRCERVRLRFAASPTPACWYRAHNASIVGGYLASMQRSPKGENARRSASFINVALVRVLFAHALVAAPRLALGRLSGLGRALGDPRLGLAGAFLSLRRVIPERLSAPARRWVVCRPTSSGLGQGCSTTE